MGHATVDATPATLSAHLARRETQAVVLADQAAPALDEASAAVERGDLVIERTVLGGVDPSTAATWLDQRLARSDAPIGRSARDALCSDVAGLVHLAEAVNGEVSHALRILTEKPTDGCGFHVDTVPAGAPVWGVLKVYNGTGPSWVEPTAVRSMRSFYDWLHRRERASHRATGSDRAARLATLDAAPGFLTDDGPAAPPVTHRVPAGATVVFRHLHADRHWDDHETTAAWIHASPSTGPTRLVVNVSPDGRAPG